MGFFDSIGSAKVNGGGVYFEPGKYLVEVEKIKMQRARKGDDMFIAECVIVESSCPARIVGSKASYVANMKHDAALGNIKGMIAACCGLSPTDPRVDTEVTPELCELAVDESVQPFKGVRLPLVVTVTKTRAGGDFSKHEWGPAQNPPM